MLEIVVTSSATGAGAGGGGGATDVDAALSRPNERAVGGAVRPPNGGRMMATGTDVPNLMCESVSGPRRIAARVRKG